MTFGAWCGSGRAWRTSWRRNSHSPTVVYYHTKITTQIEKLNDSIYLKSFEPTTLQKKNILGSEYER
jgi:hypothetical protein